jgi:phosphoglycolate phosphatase
MNIGLAIATSKPTEIAAEVVKHTMIKGFNVHVQGTDQFPPKPDPEVILRVLRLYPGVPSFMVGDRTEDMHAARSAKIPCIGIAAGAHSESKLKEAGASLTFESFQNFHQNLINNDSFLRRLNFS